MAEGNDNSIASLFIELGIDINQLESDFIEADRTVQQNLNRLNRERNLIQLRTEVEIGNLDEATEQTRILDIRARSLNQQIQIQRDRIQLTDAAFRDLRNTYGDTASRTKWRHVWSVKDCLYSGLNVNSATSHKRRKI